MTAPFVLVEHRDGIAIVTLNRPERRNGLSAGLCNALYASLQEIAETSAKVMVLRGAGRDFCVGADLSATAASETGGAPPARISKAYAIPALLHTMPQITIASIDGGCAGAGLGWASACDMRFAATRARFATAFIKVGASGDMGLAWSLMRLVGSARARELLYLSEKFDAAQALEWGLVTRVFDESALFESTLDAARTLAGFPAESLRAMKANILSAEDLAFHPYVEVETARHLHLASGPALREGFAAFRASKSPDATPPASAD
jgi:2-(1,2-epoxy-1,2-dihydrophenyl)acetyl-CoA isomerase